MAVHAAICVLRTYAASTLSDAQAVVLLGDGGAQVVGDTTEETSGVAEAAMASILCNLPVTVHEISGATGNWMRRGHDDPLSAGSRTEAAGAAVYLAHGHFHTSLPRVTIGLMARGPEAAGGLEGRGIADGVTITNNTSITPRSMAVNGVRSIMGLLNMPGNPAVELERVVTEHCYPVDDNLVQGAVPAPWSSNIATRLPAYKAAVPAVAEAADAAAKP